MPKLLSIFVALLVVPAVCQTDKKIPSSEAAQHIGEKVTVCGYVASSRYLSSSRSRPTFLNLGKRTRIKISPW
jgi:hypothetical protein